MTTRPLAVDATEGLWDLVARRAAASPDAVLVVDGNGRELTATALEVRAAAVAAALADRGVGTGTVVSWQLPSWLDAFVLTAALARLGAVQNPIVPILRERELVFITRQTGSRLLVIPRDWRGHDYAGMARVVVDSVDGLDVLVVDRELPMGDPASLDAPPVPSDECRWIFYTSGTTAEPKGARHRDRHLIAAATEMVGRLEIDADDKFAFIAPITHIGGIVQLVSALITGCELLAVEMFAVEPVVNFFRARGATLVGLGTPTFTAYLAYQSEHPELAPLFPAMRAFTSGGAPTPPALHHELRAQLGSIGVASGWGLTEAPMLTWNSVSDDDEILATTEGRPVGGVEVAAVGADGRHLAPGEEGELRVKAPQMMLGYVDPALDAAAFDEHGYFRTGDLGVVDRRGNVRITGRLKDVIIRNLENISAQELEELLFTHPNVAEVAVVGVPDVVTGERACAVVVPDGPAPTLTELCAHLRAQGLSERKLPERLVVTGALPRNAMGKVMKAEVRAAVLDELAPDNS